MKIGLFGGTFDPIHNGHLHLAQEVLLQQKLDRILFIPAGDPWMKSDTHISDSQIRKHMIDLSIDNNPNFFSSDIELNRHGPTYTSDTIEEMVEGNINEDQFFVILGSDAIKTLPLWKKPKRILELAKIILADRNCEVSPLLMNDLSRICDIAERIIFLQSKMLDISSSEIRTKVLHGRSIEGLVPNKVHEFILDSKIYN